MTANKRVESVSPGQLKQIWSKVTVDEWFGLLTEHKPDNNWTKRGKRIVGNCIYHSDNTPSFHVDLNEGFAHCFGASCIKHVWNPVRFAADIMGVGYTQALRQLKNRFGVALPAAYANNAQQIEENDELKRVIRTVMNRELREAFADPTASIYSYIEDTGLIPWLRQRMLPADVFHQLPIGVMPTRERLYERLDEIPNGKKLQEAAFSYLQDSFAMPGSPPKYEGYLVFFYCKSPTEVGRFRVRRPNTKTMYALDDPYDQHVGFLGLNMYPEVMGDVGSRPLYLVEGDFDALSVIAHQLNSGHADICIVGTGGSMEAHVDQLVTFGFKELWLVPDNDPGGVGWAQRIMEQNESVTRVFQWDGEHDAHLKDVDEAIRAHGFVNFYERLAPMCAGTDESNPAFQYNHEWVIAQASRKLETLDEGDVEARNEEAAKFGKALLKDSEREAFVDYICQEFGLSPALLMQDMLPDDTPAGFQHRIKRRLEEEYYFLSEEDARNRALINAWNRKRRIIRNFAMDSPQQIRSLLQRDIGNLEDYVKQHVGLPDFILHKTNQRGRPMSRGDIEISKMITHYFSESLSRAAGDAEPANRLVQLGQGVHYIDNPDKGEPAIFIVNGTHFFRGKFTDEGKVVYEDIDCPRFDQYLFNLADGKPWSANIKSVDDLEESSEYTPREVFDEVVKILNLGWKFYHHDLEVMFMAADALYTTVSDIFKTIVMTDISGVTHSGKTTLLQIYGGDEFAGYRLCEATRTLSDYTAAGVRNLMSGHKLRLLADEFEENDYGFGRPSQKSVAVRQILDIIRNMSSGGAESVRATATGGTRTYSLQFPLTVSGIFTMQEPRDLNRFVRIRTQRIDGYRNPIVNIQRRYSVKDMQKLRRRITLCWFSRIPELIEAFDQVKAEFADGANLPPGMYTRMVDNFLPAAAILKIVGEDYVEFVKKFSELKMAELVEQGGAVKESEEIWEEILHAPIAIYQMTRESDEIVTAVAKLLADPHKQYLLDKIDLGVYYIERRNWMVVFWKKAISGVLRNSPKYRNSQQHGHLKMVADMDPRVIARDTLARGDFLSKEVWPKVNAQIGPNEISVFDLQGVLYSANNAEPAIVDAQRRERMLSDIPGKGNFVL